MEPKISIITATRNAMPHIQTLAASILRQPQQLVEWLVIDAESQDGTVEFLRSNANPGLRWISEPDAGIYDAWNKGIRLAKGHWVMFVGADDRVYDEWLCACSGLLDTDLIYGSLEILDDKGNLLTEVCPEPWDVIKKDINRRMLLPHPGLAHNRALFNSRQFDPSFRIAGDFHFLAGAGIRSALRLPVTQAAMRLGGVSNQPKYVRQAYREYCRVLQEHGSSMPVRDRLHWLFKRAAAIAPRAFLFMQNLRWRLRKQL